MAHPGRDQIAGMGEVAKQRLVQELVPHPTIEAFDKAVLHWLAGRDVVPFERVSGLLCIADWVHAS